MKLLIVEDSPRLVELLTERIREVGWRVEARGTVEEAAAALREGEHDVVVLDLGLPDGSGLDLLRAMRRRGDMRPVLVITAHAAIEERIAGLDAGADDYLAKPFHYEEFLARCRAVARRGTPVAPPVLVAGRLRFDPATSVVSCDGETVALALRERQLAEILMRDVGRVVRKRRLEGALSDDGEGLSPNALELAVSRLRKRLESLPDGGGVAIETIRGVGYLLRTTAP